MMCRNLIFSMLAVLVGCLPAAAFDCGKASTAIEIEICDNPDLKDFDDRLENAYAEVKQLSTKPEQKMLARAQKRWIAERESSCPQSDLGLAGCIRDMTSTRLRMFEGRPDSGPGVDGRIIPVFIAQEGSETVYELSVDLLRFVKATAPGEKRFNAIAQDISKRIELGPHGEDTLGRIYAMDESLSVTYASPRLMSVLHSFWSDTGGAHGNGGTQSFNFDMQSGRDLAIADFFSEDAAAQLAAQCKDQIVAEKKERWPADEPYDAAGDSFLKDEVIAEHIATMSRWSFTETEASVGFDAYAIGPYAEGSYDCRFAISGLRAIAKPGAPLP